MQKPRDYISSRVWGRVTLAALPSDDSGIDPAEQGRVTISWWCHFRKKTQATVTRSWRMAPARWTSLQLFASFLLPGQGFSKISMVTTVQICGSLGSLWGSWQALVEGLKTPGVMSGVPRQGCVSPTHLSSDWSTGPLESTPLLSSRPWNRSNILLHVPDNTSQGQNEHPPICFPHGNSPWRSPLPIPQATGQVFSSQTTQGFPELSSR